MRKALRVSTHANAPYKHVTETCTNIDSYLNGKNSTHTDPHGDNKIAC